MKLWQTRKDVDATVGTMVKLYAELGGVPVPMRNAVWQTVKNSKRHGLVQYFYAQLIKKQPELVQLFPGKEQGNGSEEIS